MCLRRVNVRMLLVMRVERRPGEAVLQAKCLVAAGAVAVTGAGAVFEAAANAFDVVMMVVGVRVVMVMCVGQPPPTSFAGPPSPQGGGSPD